MEYSLPGPVVALLQEENASLAPKSYFISSGKKNIKITLVYTKGAYHPSTSSTNRAMTLNNAAPNCIHRKKARHSVSPKQNSKNGNSRSSRASRRHDSNSCSISPPDLQRNEIISSGDDAENSNTCSTPEFNMGSTHQSHISTVDSGHPPSSISNGGSHRIADENVFGSESEGGEEDDEEEEEEDDEGGGGEEEENNDDDENNHQNGRTGRSRNCRAKGERDCESICSSDSEKPRTPGREIASTESALGPGETPAANRDEMWQTWTRIPRQSQGRHNPAGTTSTAITTRNQHNKFMSAPALAPGRRSLSPSVASASRANATGPASHRRPRLQEGVSWDGSGNL